MIITYVNCGGHLRTAQGVRQRRHAAFNPRAAETGRFLSVRGQPDLKQSSEFRKTENKTKQKRIVER